MKNRTTILTADSRQPLFVRLKKALKQNPFTYYLSYPIWQVFKWVRWQAYKLCVKFNPDGLNKTQARERKIIVSLTSYPRRINVVPYTIASILNQTVKPDKVILWLGNDRFPNDKLPQIFDKLRACGVSIEFREDIGPHTKYFYAMKEYPEDIVITFDDDQVYDNYIIEKLYDSYTKHPNCVSAMRMVKITFKPDGNIAGYNDFCFDSNSPIGYETHGCLPEGICGILYPPHCMPNETFNIQAIKKLCPKGDDLWLKVMELMNNTKSVSAFENIEMPCWEIPASQSTALWHKNLEGGNDSQMKAIIDVYNTWRDGKTLIEMMREDDDGVE